MDALRDQQRLAAALRTLGLREEVAKLQRPDPWFSLVHLVVAWSIAILSAVLGVAAVNTNAHWLGLSALAFLGVAQRWLVVILHDAAHGNALGQPHGSSAQARALRAFVNVTCALPSFEEVGVYWRDHKAHHAFLATGRDPDLNLIYAEGLRRGARFRSTRIGALVTWAYCFGSWRTLRHSALGNLPAMRLGAGLASVALWWLAAFGLVKLFADWHAALLALSLWLAARVTTFHAIRVFGELCDHAFARTESLVAYSRTNPHQSPLTIFISPFGDSAHTAHHALMRVPLRRLRQAHALLLRVADYEREATICDGYFFGSHTVVESWFDGFRE